MSLRRHTEIKKKYVLCNTMDTPCKATYKFNASLQQSENNLSQK